MGNHLKNWAIYAGFTLNKLDRLLVAHSTDHTQVTFQGSLHIPLLVGTKLFLTSADVSISSVDDLDTGAIAAGTDYCVYACNSSGTLVFKTSLATTFPDGFDADTSRKIGGFHTLCLAVGTISGHTLTGYAVKDILPASIWDLKHRSAGLQAGMVFDAQRHVWTSIYLPSDDGAGGVQSIFGGTILDNIDWMDLQDKLAKVGCRMPRDSEFQSLAAGSNEETNITGSADPVTTGGHIDTAGRRMISNIGVEDACGVVWQWLDEQSYRFDGVALSIITASKTLTITHAASPGGNPIYLKYSAEGRPYLCCNMATDAADKILTFGSAYTLVIKHDADAATGGLQVYFDEDATQPSRLLASLTGLKDEYLETSNPLYQLKVTYNAAPGTPGVAVSFDDGADERLEFTSPTTTNGTLDLALITFVDPAFAYYDLPGAKGSLYKQGTYGDVKLLAGGNWSNAAYTGSRARRVDYSHWIVSTIIGGRAVAEPI